MRAALLEVRFLSASERKWPRVKALSNPAVSDEFRSFQGEFRIYVWCSWRLEGASQALASSDQEPEFSTRELEKLVGLTVTDLTIDERTTDLVLTFDESFVLRLFCDHLPVSPSYAGNWEVCIGERTLRAGPGFAWFEEQA